jgi:MFS family permease
MENKTKLFLIIAAVAAISQLSTDIYVPAVPTIAKNFNANINLIQTSVSIYLFGIAASLLIYGALS